MTRRRPPEIDSPPCASSTAWSAKGWGTRCARASCSTSSASGTRSRWSSRGAPTTTSNSAPREHLAVQKIWGYSIVYEDNEVQNFKTLLANVKGAVKGWPRERPRLLRPGREVPARRRHLRLRELELPLRHEPPAAGALGRQHADHQPLHARAGDPRGAGRRFPAHQGDRQGQGRRRRALLHHDLLLPAGAQAATPRCTRRSCARRSWRRGPSTGEHLLVYQTSTSNAALPEILARSGLECRIYGLRRDLQEDVRRGQPALPPVQRGGLHRRPADRARRDRQRRLHADGRGGLPAPADAGGPGRASSSSRC